jgi:pyruvate kinase
MLPSEAVLDGVIEELTDLRAQMIAREAQAREVLDLADPAYRRSARNLIHYVTLRRHDIRDLQERLAGAGLSSLGRSESYVLANVEAVLEIARHLAGAGPLPGLPRLEPTSLDESKALLDRHTTDLLGPEPGPRGVRIMVTLPTEAASDRKLVEELVDAGMDCARINCAHDGEEVWARMIENVREASRAKGRPCRVMMDLAGPKLRTGAIRSGPRVVKLRPKRDQKGRVVEPARVWLYAAGSSPATPEGADAALPVPGLWLAQLAAGDRVELEDARGSSRKLTVAEVDADGAWALSKKTCYVATGTRLRRSGTGAASEAAIGELPALEQKIPLATGDRLLLTRSHEPGEPAARDAEGRVVRPAYIACTLPEIFEDVEVGQSILFDDGKIAGRVVAAGTDTLEVEITRTRMRGGALGADKGINLPDTSLRLPALTEKDREDLRFVIAHADIVALSFVNDPSDVLALDELLAEGGGNRLGIVLKIETRRAFENLPDLLLTAMRRPSHGVMIARGDLAVECGFERLAEIQEEILWLCEAAHIPVIWATQVLESLAKEGMPSRAEVTDAAMSNRAECVMLNKGPHIVTAVRALDDILRRMGTHQTKKRSMLRRLDVAKTGRLIRELTPTSN